MEIKPIRNDRGYLATLREIEGLMGARPGTRDGDRLDVLVTLVQAWEARHFPMDLPDPVEAIKFALESKGLTTKDLVPHIGRPNRVYEVLNRKRPLTLGMIRRLHAGLGIPAEVLLGKGEETGSRCAEPKAGYGKKRQC